MMLQSNIVLGHSLHEYLHDICIHDDQFVRLWTICLQQGRLPEWGCCKCNSKYINCLDSLFTCSDKYRRCLRLKVCCSTTGPQLQFHASHWSQVNLRDQPRWKQALFTCKRMAYRHDKDGHVRLWLANQSYKYGISNFHLLYCSSSDLGSTIIAYTDATSLYLGNANPFLQMNGPRTRQWTLSDACLACGRFKQWSGASSDSSCVRCSAFCHPQRCSAYHGAAGLHVIVRRCRGCCCYYTQILQSMHAYRLRSY